MTALSLTATDKVLLHLRDYAHHAQDREYPLAMAQKGISEFTGLRLTHVPRTLKSLEGKGLVESAKAHVKGEKRRYNVYYLTEQGVEEAARVLKHLESEPGVGRAIAGCRGPVLPKLLELAGESAPRVLTECMMAGPMPDTGGFVDRERELEELGTMLEDPKVKVISIYGSLGYGTSTLASKFVRDSNAKWSTVWVETVPDLGKLTTCITRTLVEAFPESDNGFKGPKKLAEILDGRGVILVLDGYYDASEETVEFLQGLVAALKNTEKVKMLVTAREDTPSYNRFYTIMDQHDGAVGEVHVRGLDIEHCQVLLGNPDIDPEAMKRLYLFTRGKPPTIRLLAKGDLRELRQGTTFTVQEIKLMLFLKDQKKP